MARLVLSDSSPLIGLGRVGGLGWLSALFGPVAVTEEVLAEVLPGRGLPDEGAIQAALASGALLRVKAPGGDSPQHLGPGEASTLRAARAHSGPVLVLADDLAARRACSQAGIRVAGTAAVIAAARRRGLIPSAREVLERLHGSGFRLSPQVLRRVLSDVGEGF